MIKDDKTDKPAILETVFDLLRNFTQFISYSNEAAELKTMEFYLLLYIGLKGPQNMSALAKAYLMTKSNITVLVDDLENKSYVGREKSERDRRVTIIKLTRKGEAVFKEFSKNFSELIDIFLENVQEDDLVVMTDGFERIARLVVQRGLKRRKSGS
ncbi:MarR family winged helix-turn-helix transcriptional regulator [Mesotoga sp.]|uniref:MarR family winged helix-turn-helix transcriptional regulator n=1 Tax=Mesotoga sp. TaxID=2053577 RepID=UPI00260C0826|nr:MarR family transcriptional regulator [Mesotoga sp.]MDI9366898.1 MarR family transcriptional regulator [Thermotogota bacterium]MDD3680471.1 MarR family transcriptional regulator [Mesotoga sp.]MDD4207181.1 MarR family transcriptional regulator [Mesotoga sp.]MDD4825775.1 MarR family transcriptional regulator [Mesotoga sp.]MDD5682470.1 MarR family transcriptional regulator [Mesotoga sp.]